MQAGAELKHAIDRKDGEGPTAITISVKLKNLGRSRVSKECCGILVRQIEDTQLNHPEMGLVDVMPPPAGEEWHRIFEFLKGLDPGQEVTEDVLFTVNQGSTFKVTVKFVASIGPLRSLLFNETSLERLLRRLRAEQFVGEEKVGTLAKKLSAKNRVWTTSAILHAEDGNG